MRHSSPLSSPSSSLSTQTHRNEILPMNHSNTLQQNFPEPAPQTASHPCCTPLHSRPSPHRAVPPHKNEILPMNHSNNLQQNSSHPPPLATSHPCCTPLHSRPSPHSRCCA